MIRKGMQADIIKVSRLWKDLVLTEHPGVEPSMKSWRKATEKMMKNGGYFLLVNDEDGTINAFLDFLLLNDETTGKIRGYGRHLYVVPEKRKSGLGFGLVKMGEKVCWDHGAAYIDLSCVPENHDMWEMKGWHTVTLIMRKEADYGRG